MKIILNAAETRYRNRNLRTGKFSPAVLEIRQDCGDEHGFAIGLIITADRRDLESDDSNVVRLKAAWSTRQEFAKWVGQLVSFATLLGLMAGVIDNPDRTSTWE